MEQDKQNSYARIYPFNAVSRLHFSNAVRKAHEDDTYQLQFYVNDENHADATPQESQLDPNDAFAMISFASGRLPQNPVLGWRVGRGSRNIDISIATASDSRHEEDGLIRFLISVHPRSGILMLRAGPINAARLSYADEEQIIVRLEPEGTVALYQPMTRIFIGEYELIVQYNVSREERDNFWRNMAKFLLDQYQTQIHERGRCFPGAGFYTRQGKFMFGKTLGAGTYGDVSYGIDIDTGDPVALKDVRLVNDNWREELLREIKIQEMLNDCSHTLNLLACWCSEHGKHPRECSSKSREHFILVTGLALFDFNDSRLRNLPFSKTLELFRQTLLGIRDLQQRGVMHRDISRGNMLVLDTDPPRAVLNDFGKAVQRERSTNTCIGPVAYCAPEVWEGKGYTNSVDLWSWAYAVVEHLGYIPKTSYRASQITTRRLGEILFFLNDIAHKNLEYRKLTDLLMRILLWNVESRLDVEKALSHEVWKDAYTTELSPDDSPPKGSSPKRVKMSSLGSTAGASSSVSEEL